MDMGSVNHTSSADAKLALFRLLFRGRTDVYRRDRRKDQLLQENGYLILRFLAEDVGKELDLVLDAILQSLSRRSSPIPPGCIVRLRIGPDTRVFPPSR